MKTDAVGRFRPYLGLAGKVALLVTLLLVASYVGDRVTSQLVPHLTPSTETTVHRLIMVATCVYIVLMMLPFVPGAEIGLGMMAMFGPKIAPLVYGSTVLALVLSFLVGRLVPQDRIARGFRTLRLHRASSLLEKLAPMDAQERVEYLLQGASSRIVTFLLRHRFLALIVALNIPGNSVIGGGGGISLVAGFSRLFSFPVFVLLVAIAVAPVPLIVLTTDMLMVEQSSGWCCCPSDHGQHLPSGAGMGGTVAGKTPRNRIFVNAAPQFRS